MFSPIFSISNICICSLSITVAVEYKPLLKQLKWFFLPNVQQSTLDMQIAPMQWCLTLIFYFLEILI